MAVLGEDQEESDRGAGLSQWVRRWWTVVALGLALIVYAGRLWAEKWIADDGYIYLTYVVNLFEHGELAYNLGEPVDAATGFVWLVALVGARGLLFFLDPRQVAFVLSWACVLLAFLVLARRVLAGERRFLIAIALVFFTHVVVSFSTSGLETPLVILLSVAIYDRGRAHFRSSSMAVMLGIAPFVRPELGVLLVVYGCCLLRRFDGRHLAISMGALVALATARWLCFGDILPNTAFVKLLTPTYGQGWWYVYEFVASYWYFDVLLACVLGLVGWWVYRLVRYRRAPESLTEHRLFAVSSILLLVAEVGASGGDFMHGRFLLTPFLFTVLLVVDLAPPVPPSRARWASAGLAAGALAAALAATLTVPLCLRHGGFAFRTVGDEQYTSATLNPRLTAWSEPNPHHWAEEARRLNRLSVRVGRPVGVPIAALGQKGYYRDASRVYVVDKLSLISVVGSMLDVQGFYRRMAHNVLAPAPLLHVEPRLTLVRPPDRTLAGILTFEFEGHQFVLGALREVDAYVASGLLPPDTWTRVDDRIRALLEGDWVDRNAVFYLRHSYPEERPLFAQIRRAHDGYAADGSRSWITWYDQHKPLIDRALAIERGETYALPARYRVFVETGRMKPIDTIYQRSSWATRRQRVCPLDLTQAVLWADRKVRAEWHRSAEGVVLALQNTSSRRKRSAHIDLSSLVRARCGDEVEHVVLDWTVRDASGTVPSHFYVSPLEKPQRFYAPGPQLRIKLVPNAKKPLGLHFPLAIGQRYVLSLDAFAVGPEP